MSQEKILREALKKAKNKIIELKQELNHTKQELMKYKELLEKSRKDEWTEYED